MSKAAEAKAKVSERLSASLFNGKGGVLVGECWDVTFVATYYVLRETGAGIHHVRGTLTYEPRFGKVVVMTYDRPHMEDGTLIDHIARAMEADIDKGQEAK